MTHGTSRSLADRLNQLFATIRSEAGGEFSNEHVAAAIRQRGVTISQSYIWQLRKGTKTNPTLKHMDALADFFGVSTAYFIDPEVGDRITEQLERLAEARERLAEDSSGSDAKLMAMRAGQLSTERRKQVMDLLDVVYRLEQAERQNPPDK
ncbi:helix-turn-helix transcriptional regulator [Streptomyces sp. NPDC007095]|uniref:helix-turn-helix transcriptional regulator n=1 Tax=Streptomyces sp. NPDC007095 TaxID=3154482 RepID=UPI0033CB8080